MKKKKFVIWGLVLIAAGIAIYFIARNFAGADAITVVGDSAVVVGILAISGLSIVSGIGLIAAAFLDL